MTKPHHSKIDYSVCPVPTTHRRLAEAHLMWHQALSNYHDPDAFRANLNSTIQTLRNITFALQNEQRHIPDFKRWYAQWQTILKANKDAKWLHDARTTIVHQGDLDLTSLALVRVLTGRADVVAEFEIPPGIATSTIVKDPLLIQRLSQLKISKDFLPDAALEVERKWSVAALCGRELLQTLAQSYSLLSDLTLDAHGQAKRLDCIPLRSSHSDFRSANLPSGILECMGGAVEYRTQWIRLATGEPYHAVIEILSDGHADAPKRYGSGHKNSTWQKSDPLVVAEDILRRAKQVLKKDAYHDRMIFIRDGGGKWRIIILRAADRTEKHILMRMIALFVERSGGDVLIDVAEAWDIPSDAASELGRYDISDAPSRREVLQLIVVSRDGIHRAYTTPFSRGSSRRIRLDSTRQSDDLLFMQYLSPVFDVWRQHRKEELSDGREILRVWEPDQLEGCLCGASVRFIECCKPLVDHIRTSETLDDEIRKALEDRDSAHAERLARAWVAQYVTWIRQHTAPTRHVSEDTHGMMLAVDVRALQSCVQQMTAIMTSNGGRSDIAQTLLRLSDLVGVPELSLRLRGLAAISLLESGNREEAINTLKGLGQFQSIEDSLCLILIADILELPDEKSIKLLRRAARTAIYESERIAAKLSLAKLLLSAEKSDLALRELNVVIRSAPHHANRSIAEALTLRWSITKKERDFKLARKALQSLPRKDVWHQLATLLVDRGDYEQAERVLAEPIRKGNITAHLIAVDARLRAQKNDSAREMFLAIPATDITDDLQFPYAYTMGLVGLSSDDPDLRKTAATRLRESPNLKWDRMAAIVLAALDACEKGKCAT